jgi:putative PIN family toxin of toxin-antitoxin system
MASKLKLVIDTNVLLVSISRHSQWHWLYKYILDKKGEIFITTQILQEYEEKISQHLSQEAAEAVTRTLIELSNVFLITTYFNLRLITADEDDNKFVDCAFAANADYIISNDRHFDILNQIPFPSIKVVRLEDFQSILKD